MGWQSGTAPQARRRATTRNGAPSMAVAVPGRAQEFERAVGSVTDICRRREEKMKRSNNISPPSSIWSDCLLCATEKDRLTCSPKNPRYSKSKLKNYSEIGFQGQSALGKLAFDDTQVYPFWITRVSSHSQQHEYSFEFD